WWPRDSPRRARRPPLPPARGSRRPAVGRGDRPRAPAARGRTKAGPACRCSWRPRPPHPQRTAAGAGYAAWSAEAAGTRIDALGAVRVASVHEPRRPGGARRAPGGPVVGLPAPAPLGVGGLGGRAAARPAAEPARPEPGGD